MRFPVLRVKYVISYVSILTECQSHHLQDIDTALTPLAISKERFKVVDFPSAIFDGYGAALTTTQPKNKFFVIQPVHYSVWLFCCFIVFVVSIYLHWFETLSLSLRLKLPTSMPRNLYSMLWTNFSVLLNQGNRHFTNDIVDQQQLLYGAESNKIKGIRFDLIIGANK